MTFRWVRGIVEEIDCEGLTLRSQTGKLLSGRIVKLMIAKEPLVKAAGPAVFMVIPQSLAEVPALVAVWNAATEDVVSVIRVVCSIYDPDNRLTSIEGVEVARSLEG